MNLVCENLNDILIPKVPLSIIKDLFKDTNLENADPNEMFHLDINSILGGLGEKILKKNNIDYDRISHNKYVLSSSLFNFILHFINIEWNPEEIKEYLNNKLYK